MISYHPQSSIQTIGKTYTYGFLVMPWFDVRILAKVMVNKAWSPIVWHDGHRQKENFKRAAWVALDFDDPQMDLAQAQNVFCDMKHVIGPTRNHQREKNGVVCDRFRVLLQWDHPITDWRTYQWNAERLIAKYDADRACSDPARHFFPCLDIVSIAEEGYTLEWYPHPPDYKPELSPEEYQSFITGKETVYNATKKLPRHIETFLKNGAVFGEGRNQSCYVTAQHLLECGFSADGIISLLRTSPFSRHHPWQEQEIESAVHSAVKSVLSRLTSLSRKDEGSYAHD